MRWLLYALLCLYACKEQSSSQGTAQSPQDGLSFSSSAFQTGQTMPVRYSCKGQNLSPRLLWSKVPPETRSLALTLEDPDAPGGSFVHWLIYNIPPEISILPEGLPIGETLSLGALQGNNDFGQPGYAGPCPPAGQNHEYIFRLYALDRMLSLPPGSGQQAIAAELKNHILGRAEIRGRFRG